MVESACTALPRRPSTHPRGCENTTNRATHSPAFPAFSLSTAASDVTTFDTTQHAFSREALAALEEIGTENKKGNDRDTLRCDGRTGNPGTEKPADSSRRVSASGLSVLDDPNDCVEGHFEHP